jgi:hypothetical protein
VGGREWKKDIELTTELHGGRENCKQQVSVVCVVRGKKIKDN